MKSFFSLTGFYLLFVLLVACGSAENKTEALALDDKNSKIERRIAKLEKLNFDTENPSQKDAFELLEAYQHYVKENPDDEKAADYLYKASGLAIGLNNPSLGVLLMDKVLENYKSYPKSDEVLFQKAFTLDFQLEKKEEAKIVYELFIEKYPNSKLTLDAKARLETINLSDEDLLKLLKSKSVNN